VACIAKERVSDMIASTKITPAFPALFILFSFSALNVFAGDRVVESVLGACAGQEISTFDQCYGRHSTEKFEYEGEWSQGRRHGLGALIYKDGARSYVGQWSSGRAEGLGKFQYADGSFYDGSWKNNKRHGLGVHQYADGSVYEGEWVEDRRQGKGLTRFSNGSSYEGAYVQDKPNGLGLMIHPKDTELAIKYFHRYEGEFVNGMPRGEGEWINNAGDVYRGQVYDGLPNGAGIMDYADGRVYRGGWRVGLRHGDGRIDTADRQSSYEGQWNRDQMEGEGVLVYPDGGVYTGSVVDGRAHGIGVKKDSNGVIYDGEWISGRATGEGVLTAPDGTRVEGVFEGGALIDGLSLERTKFGDDIDAFVEVSVANGVRRFNGFVLPDGSRFNPDPEGSESNFTLVVHTGVNIPVVVTEGDGIALGTIDFDSLGGIAIPSPESLDPEKLALFEKMMAESATTQNFSIINPGTLKEPDNYKENCAPEVSEKIDEVIKKIVTQEKFGFLDNVSLHATQSAVASLLMSLDNTEAKIFSEIETVDDSSLDQRMSNKFKWLQVRAQIELGFWLAYHSREASTVMEEFDEEFERLLREEGIVRESETQICLPKG